MSTNKKTKWTKKTKIIVGIVVGFLILVAIVTPTEEKQKDSQSQTTQSEKPRDSATLDVKISHDNLNMIIQSNESKDLGGCKLKLNSDYTYDASNRYLVNAGQEAKIGLINFTKKDSTRFNIYTTKPQSLRMDCDRKDGDSGSADIFWN